MDVSKLSLFKMMSHRMSYNGARQDVLSQNVANADTPGFRGYDLKPIDFSDTLRKETQKIKIERTSSMHQSGGHEMKSDFRAEKDREPFEKKLADNRINLEEQMMKVATNSFEYQTAISTYKKTAEIIKIALGRGN